MGLMLVVGPMVVLVGVEVRAALGVVHRGTREVRPLLPIPNFCFDGKEIKTFLTTSTMSEDSKLNMNISRTSSP